MNSPIRLHYAFIETTLGTMLVVASEKGVCCISFNEGDAQLHARYPQADLVEGGEEFQELFEAVARAVENPADAFDIPLDVQGSDFQRKVWAELQRIPAGETRTYGELARKLGNPNGSRAVGGANGANTIAVLIPCHRVLQADGSLGGYAYGTQIKAELLRREQPKTPMGF